MFKSLIKDGANTQIGRDFNLSSVNSWEQFSSQMPIFDYDSFKPYVERMMAGELNVSTKGAVRMYAKSSGTTSDRSKFIPVSDISLKQNHMLGMRDVGAIYTHNFPKTSVFNGKFLTLGGSSSMEGDNLIGDLSGLLIRRFVWGSGWFRAPKMSTALIPDFHEKCELICKECTNDNITAFAGVPSWNLALMSKILEHTGKSTLREVWPNLELFVHGGIEMTPYYKAFDQVCGGNDMRYMETYNASEGFFAIADDPARSDMLLMLDYYTFYEFRDGDNVCPLEGVKCGVPYAMIITSTTGLWRYEIGDMVEFTSVAPYRIRFAGRTRQFINVFGEEVIVDNSDKAIVEASERHGAVVRDYTLGPQFMGVDKKGCHQWLIEFVTPPKNLEVFTNELDAQLRMINSDYDAKRTSTLDIPDVVALESGTLLDWMQVNHKNKVPRLSNDRRVIESILSHVESRK